MNGLNFFVCGKVTTEIKTEYFLSLKLSRENGVRSDASGTQLHSREIKTFDLPFVIARVLSTITIIECSNHYS